jgi:hypothetical protein
MIAPNENNPAPVAKKEIKPEAKTVPVAEPTVEKVGTYQPGQKVKHDNGTIYEVRYQTEEGVALLHVGNLVHPSAIRPV